MRNRMGHERGPSSVCAGEGRSGWNPWRQRSQLGRRGGPVLRREGEGSARDTPEQQTTKLRQQTTSPTRHDMRRTLAPACDDPILIRWGNVRNDSRPEEFDASCPPGRRGQVCALGLSLLLSADLDEVAGAVRSISGRVEGTLLASARPAVDGQHRRLHRRQFAPPPGSSHTRPRSRSPSAASSPTVTLRLVFISPAPRRCLSGTVGLAVQRVRAGPGGAQARVRLTFN